jgi:Flp pilus assembly protein TadG
MKRMPELLARARRRSFVRDERGVAAIEFALISTGMFAMLSGAVDLTQAITINRDLHRLAAEAAQVVVACPNLDCRRNVFLALNTHGANIAPQLASMQISGAFFGKDNDTIVNMEGTMTQLPAGPPDAPVNMRAQALAMLANGDRGVAVLAKYTHQPIILGLAQKWGFSTKNFAAPVVNLASRPSP